MHMALYKWTTFTLLVVIRHKIQSNNNFMLCYKINFCEWIINKKEEELFYFQIDLQWFFINCDALKPAKDNCGELKVNLGRHI